MPVISNCCLNFKLMLNLKKALAFLTELHFTKSFTFLWKRFSHRCTLADLGIQKDKVSCESVGRKENYEGENLKLICFYTWHFYLFLIHGKPVLLIEGLIITMHDKESNNAKASSKSCTCNLQLLNIKDTQVGSQTAPLKSANTIIAVRTAH